MKTQKQSRVDSLEKKMAATTNVLQHMMSELAYIKDLCIGTLETIKQMPDYEEAIQKLKEKVAEKPGEAKEADTGGKTIE
jgi:biotin synthase-related radical SAM superfamily protein